MKLNLEILKTQKHPDVSEVVKRWTEMGLLNGLTGLIPDNIARLYESQASYLIQEAQINNDNNF